MTGAEFEAEGHRLARTYALIRPNGPTWLAAWQTGETWAADEIAEWELEGHPFHPSTWNNTGMMTVTEVLDAMLALYDTPGTWMQAGIAQDAAGRSVEPNSAEAVAWSLEGALERVMGDLEGGLLLSDLCDACGVDLAAFGGIARHQLVVVGVLRLARSSAALS